LALNSEEGSGDLRTTDVFAMVSNYGLHKPHKKDTRCRPISCGRQTFRFRNSRFKRSWKIRKVS